MAYTPYYNSSGSPAWQNGSSGNTPINAAALNNIEQGLINVDAAAIQQKGTMPTNTAVNTVVTPGLYYIASNNTYTGLPTGVTWGTLLILRPRSDISGFTVQVMFSGSSSTNIYVRMYVNNAWTTWRTI